MWTIATECCDMKEQGQISTGDNTDKLGAYKDTFLY